MVFMPKGQDLMIEETEESWCSIETVLSTIETFIFGFFLNSQLSIICTVPFQQDFGIDRRSLMSRSF